MLNELVKITEKEGKQTVSARELHEFLESKQDFSNWIKARITKYDFQENADFSTFDKFIEREGSNLKSKRTEYVLSLNMAKELAMLENNEKGRKARRYFIKCEENLIEAVKQNMVPKEMYLEAAAELKELETSNELLAKNYNDIRLMYQNTTNEVAEYVNTQIKYSKSGKVKCNDLYNHYCRWCRNTPHYEPYPKQQFEDLLLERMVQGHSIKKDGSNYIGIEVNK